MIEVRIHGRGGQGVVTAAELIAESAFEEGYFAQAFPLFGVERSGAPIQAFARISQEPIIIKEQIYHPDFLLIQDATLLDQIAIFTGLKKTTKILVNSPRPAEAIINDLRKIGIDISINQLQSTPATEIALEIIGKNIVNTLMLGAFAKSSGLISLNTLKKTITNKFSEKGKNIVEKNISAVTKAYNYEEKGNKK